MKKTKSFTMIEVLMTALLISIGLLTVFEVMNYAKKVNQRVSETLIANQLATEGAEILYQIRNTNFIKYENEKQKYIANCNSGYENYNSGYENCIKEYKNTRNINRCWLALDYDACINNNNYNNNLGTGCYYITNTGGQNFLNEYTTGSDCETDGFINEFAICLNSGTRIPCTGGHVDGHDESRYGKYFRNIQGQGVFDMSSDTTGGTMLKTNELSGKVVQEYRFCSYVSRGSIDTGSIEICSTMTNFID